MKWRNFILRVLEHICAILIVVALIVAILEK